MDATQAIQEAFAALLPIANRERVERYRLERTLEFVEKSAGGYRDKRVLELGSSFGLHLIAAKKMGARTCSGVDKFLFPEAGESDFVVPAADMERLRSVWSAHGLDMQQLDLADPFPFADGSVDLIVCNAVIEHLHGIHRHVFAEAARVLAPGGHFVFTTPNICSLLKRLRCLVGRSPLWDIKDYFESELRFTGHVREFTVKEARQMLEWSGFEPVSVLARPGYFRFAWIRQPKKWLTFVIQSFSWLRPTWGDLIYAVGKKKV